MKRRRPVFLLATALFLALMGWGVRTAEDGQVGYTHDASMWIFVAAGICLYAFVLSFVLRRKR